MLIFLEVSQVLGGRTGPTWGGGAGAGLCPWLFLQMSRCQMLLVPKGRVQTPAPPIVLQSPGHPAQASQCGDQGPGARGQGPGVRGQGSGARDAGLRPHASPPGMSPGLRVPGPPRAWCCGSPSGSTATGLGSLVTGVRLPVTNRASLLLQSSQSLTSVKRKECPDRVFPPVEMCLPSLQRRSIPGQRT